ncbi:hypothetical protein ACIBG8_54220 [Nonomuraea sp. NPDC050556]|uniref:hypothetical protein n=1 Tax=Nonomuraea sp. NPDC050556 TaxID=3364369 RepID=UPI0037B754FA
MAETTPVFELDVDDVAIAAPPPKTATIRMGGRVYTATCPKDAVWAELIAAGRQGSNVGTRLHGLLRFLDVVFGSDQSDELEQRYRDPKDVLNYSHLVLARTRLEELWKEWVEERFAAIGLLMADEDLDEQLADPTTVQVTEASATATAKKKTTKDPRRKAA